MVYPLRSPTSTTTFPIANDTVGSYAYYQLGCRSMALRKYCEEALRL